MNAVLDVCIVPMSYLEYYHNESIQNPHYTTKEQIEAQREVLKKLKAKGGVGEDNEVAVKRKDLEVFGLVH